MALYISLQKKIEGFDESVDGKGVARAEAALDKIARKLGVTPLMDFFSASAEEMKDFDVDIPDAPPATFFDGNAGLRTVQALRAYLEQHPKELKDGAWVLDDLKEFERVLSKAAEHCVGWHLCVDT